MVWSKWYLSKSKHGELKFVIRRYRKVAGKTQWDRYPADKYRGMSEDELTSLLRQLNVTHELKSREAEVRYDFDHSFVKKEILNSFEVMLQNSASRTGHINGLLSYLNRHTLDFFINTIKKPHPNFWPKHEHEWGAYLLKKQLSPNTLKQIVQVSNRFLKFMHKQNPDQVHAIVLEPFSKKKLQDLAARLPSTDRKKLITPEHYKLMMQKCREDLRPYISIGYLFGLRISEIYALSPDQVLKGCLSVTRQIVKVEPRVVYGPLKSKQVRKVPYWFSSPKEAFELIASLRKLHPNTVSDYFAIDMQRLELPFEFHDLRRTFITNALRTQPVLRDVQMAAGHYDIKTTIGYAQDDRDLDEEVWIPS